MEMSDPQAENEDSSGTSVATAEEDQQSFGERPVSEPAEPCPIVELGKVVLIPRKAANIFADDKSIKTLLPDRYPTQGAFLKQIEYHFYPDLNQTRTITAVVTEEVWEPERQYRPTPRQGVTVYFALGGGTTADVTLSANEATTDAEGCASINVTVNTLNDTKESIEAAAMIEVVASLEPSCRPMCPTLTLTIHRNEDVDQPLPETENPGDFTTALRPVIDLETWIVRQRQHYVTSHGALAVQQLLNQVSIRKRTGGHSFLKPDGQFGSSGAREAGRFIHDFRGAVPAGDTALQAYEACQFGVSVEDDARAGKGVKTYVRAEYGSYAEGDVIDGHLLVGLESWSRGSGSNVMDADGLLDIYAAVVWEFLQTLKENGDNYATLSIRWMRHQSDNGCSQTPHPHPGTAHPQPWPDAVNIGVSYTFGGAASTTQFQQHLNANSVSPTAITTWNDYDNGSKVGMHKSEYNAQPTQRKHFTGIDCSAFIQRCAMQASFRPAHCADLAGERICRRVPSIGNRTATNFPWPHRLGTGTWPQYYRRIPNRSWKKRVVYWMDVLNITGSHIVLLDANNRNTILNPGNPVTDIQILEAGARLTVPNGCPAQTECTRRVRNVSLRYFGSFYNSFINNTNQNTRQYGRIHIWE